MTLDDHLSYTQAQAASGYEFSNGSRYQLPEHPFTPPPELRTQNVVRHDIVIVGGGWVGLSLACALDQYGVKAVLLDEDNTVGIKGASSRGIFYAQKTLEIFKRLDIYERMAAKGVQWSVSRTFARLDKVYSLDLASATTYNASLQPPFVNIQQFYVEGFLVEKLMAAPDPTVELRRNNRITGFKQNNEPTTLDITTAAGNYTIEAVHVTDCSGARSPFRA